MTKQPVTGHRQHRRIVRIADIVYIADIAGIMNITDMYYLVEPRGDHNVLQKKSLNIIAT